jgi:hypothetical protein
VVKRESSVEVVLRTKSHRLANNIYLKKKNKSHLKDFWFISIMNLTAGFLIPLLIVGAFCARLDNTYIPPPANAYSAGGFNLETPKVAHASNVQNTYSAPGVQHQYQQQFSNQQGSEQGTFTSVSKGQGFQSVAAGAHSSSKQQAHSSPQQSYQQQQQSYQQQSSSQQAQLPQYNNFNQQSQNGYNQQGSTTPIPILKCKLNFHRQI